MFSFDPEPDIIKAPDDPASWPQFRQQLADWRVQRRKELQYSDALYARADFAWVPSSYACYFWMLNDQRFCDPASGQFRTAELLAFLHREFGGVDSLVLWHAYPRIGLDERNQADFYRQQPGGLAGLRKVVDALHHAKVRVYINYNPWDTGTRREAVADVDMLCEIVAAVGIDGIFLDTMKEGGAEFRGKLDTTRAGVALEGEIALPMERIADHHLAWAQGFRDSHAPGVVRNKYFERRHMLHHVQRWSFDRTAQLHTAFMNGTGTMVWDNVFGSWMGYSPREKGVMKTMFAIQRRYSALFAGERWTPLVPLNTTTQGLAGAQVFASLWEGDGVRLWTLVNRLPSDLDTELSGLTLAAGERLWDLVTGREVGSSRTTLRGRGIGCFIVGDRKLLGADFDRFLAGQKALHDAADWCANDPGLTPVPTIAAATAAFAGNTPPPGMVVLAGGNYRWGVQFKVRECGLYDSNPLNIITDMSRINELLPVIWRDVVLAPFAIDATPVTNAEFARFIQASGYRPAVADNFLKHWDHKAAAPSSLEDHPVVWVSLDDARAYAKWAGKRLPTEAQWQFAAQGNDKRKYPWGDADPRPGDDLCNGGGNQCGTTAVKAFAKGRSAAGVDDLCGNVWEWTDSERSDGVNRFSIIRGGSFYSATGSRWYMEGGPVPNNRAVKFIHSSPGLDRCATVGFRCVADAS